MGIGRVSYLVPPDRRFEKKAVILAIVREGDKCGILLPGDHPEAVKCIRRIAARVWSGQPYKVFRHSSPHNSKSIPALI